MIQDRVLPPSDELLAVDIGNTRIGLAVWDDDGLHGATRVQTGSPEQWPGALERAWRSMDAGRRRAVVISSVAPARARAFASLAAEVCEIVPAEVGRHVPLPMRVRVENPAELGVDRVCSAAAAFDRLRTACAIASFGTAITIDCVSAEGEFLGGTILPGLQMSCDALQRGAEQLPHVEATTPETPFGLSTQQAIQAGVGFGAVGALREIVERFATELREWPHVVLTGGAAPLIAPLADFVDSHVPDLCLMGVALAYRKATGDA